MKTLHIVGCGHVGKTLARLWSRRKLVEVGAILNRSLASGRAAVDFLGAGHAVEDYSQFDSADLVMISSCDASIEACCGKLCQAGVLRPGTIVFHCSGSLSSRLLASASASGAHVASLHPVKSFADPARAVETFSGTFCAIEGDEEAGAILGELLRAVGGVPFSVKAEGKTVYHAGTVIVCNYLAALIEAGLRCFQQAGIPRETAMELIGPIVRGTVDNVFTLGTSAALTGPIARGETSVVQAEYDALGEWDETIQRVYRSLGHVAVQLSATQGSAAVESLEAIRKVLSD